MNAFGDATMALAFFVLIVHSGSLAFATRSRPRAPLVDDGQPRRARPARRRRGEVGADPAPHVAAGRDGGPDAGLRAHPRGDDGHRRRLPDRAHASDLRAGAHGRARRRRHGRADAARRRADRARADRHQARDRVLDDVADRLHVPRRGHRGVRERDVPPDDARVLQGAALHGGRPRHPRARGRAGHPQDGRHRQADAVDALGVPRGRARARRHPAVRAASSRRTRSSPPRCTPAGTASSSGSSR